MSIPRPKTPPSESTTGKMPSDSSVGDKAVAKTLRKPQTISSMKSHIPKHGKTADSARSPETGCKDGDHQSIVRPHSKSQEKPPHTAGSSSSTGASLRSKQSVTSAVGNGTAPNQKRILENQFSSKKKRYVTIKNEIEGKQKSSEAMYEELFQLREKILTLGGKDPGKLEELLPVPVVATTRPGGQGCDFGAGEQPDSKDLPRKLEASLEAIAEATRVFCREALDKQLCYIESSQDDPSNSPEESTQKLETCRMELAEFESQLETKRQEHLRHITELAQRADSLWRECRVHRQERHDAKSEGDSAAATAQNDRAEELAKELRAEKDKLMKVRTKQRLQETALAAAQENNKQLEAQLKQKEATLELKLKELAKYQKSHDSVLSKLEKEKDSVETRAAKLQEELDFKENENESLISEHNKQVEDLENKLEEERKSRQELESQFEEFKLRNAKLEEKCKELLEMQENGKQDISDDHPTEYEIQLFNDLKETQAILAEKEEMIKKLQIEREDIIAAANEAGQEKDCSKENLAAELLKKSSEVETLKRQVTQLQKNYKRATDKAEHLENKLLDMNKLQAQMQDGSRAAYGAQMIQMQQELIDLRSTLKETTKHNAELEQTCTQLHIKLHQYKSRIRTLEEGLKVRREVQQLLQNKDIDPHYQCPDQDNYHSVDSEDYQQLYSTLENKELQIMKLEKLVKQMEKQEEYSQAQRTRLETRIARLEVAVKEGQQSQRNRGFSFL